MNSRTFSISLLALLLLVLYHDAQAQNNWSPVGPREPIISILTAQGTDYVLNNAGIYVRTGDNFWAKISDLPDKTITFNSMVILPTGEILLFGYDLYYISTDHGSSWTKVNQPGFSTRVAVSDKLGYIFAGQNNPIKRSTDKGLNWSDSKEGTSNDFFDIGVLSLADNGDILAGNQGITGGMLYRSTDRGGHWQLIYQKPMTDITAAEEYKGTVYVASTDGLYYTDDYGINWKKALTLTSTNLITSIQFVLENDGYAGFSRSGISYTGDRGYTWDSNSIGAQGKLGTVLHLNGSHHLLMGTDSGLFLLNSISEVGHSVEGSESMRTSPNPCDRSVTVSLPTTSSYARLTVTDLLGRMRGSMRVEPGQPSAQFNVSQFEPGIYFARIESNQAVGVSKFTVWR